MRRVHCFIVVFGLLPVGRALAHDWPQFRGPNGSGVTEEAKLPDSWSAEKNIQWKVAVPGVAWSSPIVWGDKVFVTTAVTANQRKPRSDGGGRGRPGGFGGGRPPFGDGGERPGPRPDENSDPPEDAPSGENPAPPETQRRGDNPGPDDARRGPDDPRGPGMSPRQRLRPFAKSSRRRLPVGSSLPRSGHRRHSLEANRAGSEAAHRHAPKQYLRQRNSLDRRRARVRLLRHAWAVLL